MVQSLKLLAENTLIRDILFSKESSPLVSFCYKSKEFLNFERQFKYNGKIYTLNESLFIPSSIGYEVYLFDIAINILVIDVTIYVYLFAFV